MSALDTGKVSASVLPVRHGGNQKNIYTQLHIALRGFANASFAQCHGLEGKEL
ncbi:MAG TPA: hypothetical protein VJ643_00825 [Nitrososphaera sp.]|nr:hypothetical protein [Nitrososphaera sp.]